MQLRQHIRPLQGRAVALHLSRLLRLLAVVLALPVVVALAARDASQAMIFAGLAAGAWIAGLPGGREGRHDLALREALVTTALAYPLFALVGALAYLPAAPLEDGFFEALSGFTTTGLSVIDPAGLPPSLLFFRAYSQWVGGAGIIVLSLVVLAHPGRPAYAIRATELASETNLLGNAISTARVVLSVYGALTLGGVALLRASGMPWFDGLLHALSGLSTGGFSSQSASLGAYGSASRLIVVVLMILGATSFPLFYLARRDGPRRFFGDEQLRYLLAITVVATVLFVASGGWRFADAPAALFHVTASLTTTGYAVGDPSEWSAGQRLVSSMLMFIGGSTGSTAGGIKLVRIILLVRLVFLLLQRTLLPAEARIPLKVNGIPASSDDVLHVAGLITAYTAVAATCALILTAADATFADAIFEATSALGTVGLSTGVTSPALPVWAKLTLCLTMWVGRLEVFPVLLLAHRGNWRVGLKGGAR